MTQVKEWSNQELNRKLAELMGWKELVEYDDGAIYGFPPDDRWSNRVPDYCTDPAASLEVQAKALEINSPVYLMHLANCIDGPTSIKKLLLATPRERADAAYITLREAK